MPNVDFSRFAYYPALQCTVGEHLGYAQLSNDDKDALLPIMEISQRSYDQESLVESIEDIRSTVGDSPFLLDLCKELAPPPYIPKDKSSIGTAEQAKIDRQIKTQQKYNTELSRLLKATNGFEAWRNLTATFPNCVPVLQFSNAIKEVKNLLQEAEFFAANGAMAIRLTSSVDEKVWEIVNQIFDILKDPRKLLVIIDCAQARSKIEERSEFVRQAVINIQAKMKMPKRESLRVVCMGNSFPASPNHSGIKTVGNLDWDIWSGAGDFPLFFGDYAATYRLQKKDTFVPGDWRATVVYPLDRSWHIYRHPNAQDTNGWIEGSKSILNLLSGAMLPIAWGAQVIERAANDNIDGLSSSRYWHAAKVNLHLHRQIRFAKEMRG